MKKQIVRAMMVAALAAAVSMPAVAQVKSVFTLNGGQLRLDQVGNGGDVDLDVFGANVSALMAVGPGMVVQGDLALEGFENDTARTDGITGTAHIGWQNSDYAIGAYVGVDDAAATAGPYSTVFGGEVVMFMQQATVSVGGGFGTYDNAAGTDTTKSGLEAEGRYFINENLRIDLRAGYNKFSPNVGLEQSGFGLGGGVEWKPANTPVSFFASYDGYNLDTGAPGSSRDGSVALVGVKFDLGNKTLKSRDRTGPVFKPMAGFSATTALY